MQTALGFYMKNNVIPKKTLYKTRNDSPLETFLQQISSHKGLKNLKFSNLMATAFEKNAKLEVVYKTIHIQKITHIKQQENVRKLFQKVPKQRRIF